MMVIPCNATYKIAPVGWNIRHPNLQSLSVDLYFGYSNPQHFSIGQNFNDLDSKSQQIFKVLL
jgi:hypothetical protein